MLGRQSFTALLCRGMAQPPPRHLAAPVLHPVRAVTATAVEPSECDVKKPRLTLGRKDEQTLYYI